MDGGNDRSNFKPADLITVTGRKFSANPEISYPFRSTPARRSRTIPVPGRAPKESLLPQLRRFPDFPPTLSVFSLSPHRMASSPAHEDPPPLPAGLSPFPRPHDLPPPP